MSKLKLAGPALLFVGFLLPCFAQNATASMFAKQVKHDIAALSSQPSVGAWQELHPDEKLELMYDNHGKDYYEGDLGMDFYSWCAALPSRSPSTFGRVALFFVPSVKAGALPPLPALDTRPSRKAAECRRSITPLRLKSRRRTLFASSPLCGVRQIEAMPVRGKTTVIRRTSTVTLPFGNMMG